VVELADIFREYGPAYRDKFGEQMLPSHHEAMWAIEHCRTETLGGHIYHCPDCDETVYRYHSCRNRHCPKCQGGKAYQWLEQQHDLLLPVPYFMLTFTLPEGLRPIARSHPTLIYDVLFRTSAAATQQLARDPRFVGGQIGMVGVLHTWGRTLTFHPHIHYLIPAGGLAADGQTWQPAQQDFLLPVKALSPIFRAKVRDALHDTEGFSSIPARVWEQEWVVHCQPVGNGRKAFEYLAPYIFRVALSNSRLVSGENNLVTFRYRDSNTGQAKLLALEPFEFIHRFLQHVLPKGFVKVRYYGFLAPGARPKLALIRQQLSPPVEPDSGAQPARALLEAQPDAEARPPDPTPSPTQPDTASPPTTPSAPDTLAPDPSILIELEDENEPDAPDESSAPAPPTSAPLCPACGQPMRRCASLPPKGRSPP
jgi:hypothetical protein